VEQSRAYIVYHIRFTFALAFISSGNTVSFSISGSGSSDFTIHATSGVITLSQALDYEKKASYSLTVAASDSNGGFTTTSLTVTVTDSNDPPVSISSSYTASIDEDVSAGTKVVQTSATDQDGNTITYSISGSSDFSITSTGMIKTAATLDFETTASYSLTVSFSDGVVTVTKAVSITVVNKNDAPSLPSSPYTASVVENTAIGTTVYNVSAVDADGDSMVYSLSGAGSTHFTINTLTGAVATSQALNYEAAASYSLTSKWRILFFYFFLYLKCLEVNVRYLSLCKFCKRSEYRMMHTFTHTNITNTHSTL
jgi:hypothetical protein